MKHQRIVEFAELIGVSHTAVRKAIDRGRIPANVVRTKELPSGRKVTLITNPVAARAAFLASRDITDSTTTDDDSAGDTPVGASRRTWNADEIIEMVDDEYLFARKVLLAIPAKVAASLAACTDAKQTQTILEDAIRDALDDLTSDIDKYYADDISDIEPETSASTEV